jgi:DNA modification methylase
VTFPTPYYEQDGITIYHGDCREILPTLEHVDLVLTDPPYGMGVHTDNRTQQRSKWGQANDYDPVAGDDEPYDPAPLMRFPRLIIFGANNFASRLPESTGWIVWDKLDGLTSKREVGFNDNSDIEIAWTNISTRSRLFRHRWMGAMKGSERGQKRLHPTQKPIVLMERIIQWATDPGDLVLDPYMGSGSTLVAAASIGRRAIGIEISEAYCEIAARRLQQSVLPLEVA